MVRQMQAKILIVEDEFLVALHLKMMLVRLGFEIVGIAPDMQSAYSFAKLLPDIALVDVNLRDGPTGPEIGGMLAREFGAAVMFVTANPGQLNPVPAGPLGVITKPINDNEVGLVLNYIVDHLQGKQAAPPPNMTLFCNLSASNTGT